MGDQRRERAVFQLTLPDQFTPQLVSSGVTPTPRHKEDKSYPRLSGPKLELVASALAHPHEQVPDPRQQALPQHADQLSRLILGEAADITGAWRTALPTVSKGYLKLYEQEVERRINTVSSSRPGFAGLLQNILHNPALATIRGHSDYLRSERLACCEIITDETINALEAEIDQAWQRERATGRMVRLAADPQSPFYARARALGAELPWPPAAELAKLCTERLWEKVSDRSAQIAEYEELQPVAPSEIAASNLLAVGTLGAVGLSLLDHDHEFHWSGSLDMWTFGQAPKQPHRIYHVITATAPSVLDSNDATNDPHDEKYLQLLGQAEAAATFLQVQHAAHLPQPLPNNNNPLAIRFPNRPDIHPDVCVKINNPLVDMNATSVFTGADPNSRQILRRGMQDLAQLAITIRGNRDRLGPILK